MAETNPILKLLEPTGLTIRCTDSWHEISFAWADNLYTKSMQPFAKYLFTLTDAAQWNQWERWGDSFVTEIIEPVYFQLANDVSWNLYWVNILEEEQLNQIDPRQKFSFTSNTEYTRNLMVPLEHLTEWIPISRIPEYGADGEIISPSEIWLEQLDKKGLAFCLDEYSTKALDAYVDGTAYMRKVASTPSGVVFDEKHQLSTLQAITIPKNFREHYYSKDWTIPFQTVNLLYGLNGAGKTSVLSAIELAMTGEIRSLTVAEHASAETEIGLVAKIDGRTVELHPPREPAEKKDRERQFYKSRNTNRTAPQLQNLFHRFNYLSVEETFLFASEQPDVSEIFSQILYGPETSNMWRNLERYKENCSNLIAKFEQEFEDLDGWLKALPDVSPADRASIGAYLVASGLHFDPEEPLESIITKTQMILAEYDKVQEFAPVLSQDQLRVQQADQAGKFRILNEEIEKLSEELEQAKARESSLIGEEMELRKGREACEKALASIQELDLLVKQLQFRIEHEAILAGYQQCLANQTACEEKIKQLKHFLDIYAGILELPPSKSIQQVRKEMRELQKKHRTLEEALNVQKSEIEEDELNQEKRTTLLSTLRTTGLELYYLDGQRDSCPLCGSKGITETVLRTHLERESIEGGHRLQELYHARLDIESEIQKTNSALKKLGQQEVVIQEYNDALNAVQQKFPSIQNAAELRQEYENIQIQLNAAREQETYIWKTLQGELERAGFISSVEDIWNSRQMLLSKLPSEFIPLPVDVTDRALVSAVSTAQLKWKERKEAYGRRLTQNQDALEQQKGTVDLIHRGLEQELEQQTVITEEALRLKQISAFWESIDSFIADPVLSGDSVRSLCQHIHDMAHSIIESIHCREERRSCREKMADIQVKLTHCRTLQNMLANLQAPKVYADAFISQNVAQISRIFLALHSPQEFTGLDVDDHQLVAFRNGEKVPISHMSTGQRTALVIAVFFQMNLATPMAPSFLLLDEPVANIDDLNVLALMDFLREIVITHKRQVFFTTANRNVARLFRRKFSFLLEDFQELRFFREKEHNLRIEKRSYDQSNLLANSDL